MAKLNQMSDVMATRTDSNVAKSDIMQATRVAIAEAVEPLQNEMCELRDRVTKLEIGGAATAGPSKPGKKILNLLNSVDVANKRISFIGAADVSAEARVDALEAVMEEFQKFDKSLLVISSPARGMRRR